MGEPLLAVRDLTVRYRSAPLPAVAGVTFALDSGESLGIFGKSGSGKTTLARSVLRIAAWDDRVTSGSIRFRGTEILALKQSRLRKIRGRDLAFISQEPELALNPVLTVGQQIVEVLKAHLPGSARVQREQARNMLGKVRLDDPAIFHAYPHQLSGGQRQRVVIAQALVCKPALLIADEPTSALDVRTQAEVVALLQKLKKEFRLSLILISHNIELLRGVTDRLASMNEGRMAENPVSEPVRSRPTQLFADSPAVRPCPTTNVTSSEHERTNAVLEVRRLFKSYRRGNYLISSRHSVTALAGVDFKLPRAKTVALVGESGSGKTTLARCLARLEDPDSGEIRFEDREALHIPRDQITRIRRRVQLVFQHSATAMNPYHTAEDIVGEPLRVVGEIPKLERRDIVLNWMERAGISPLCATRRPWQFSGGQRQRLAIARAMILDPDVVIFDEAFAGLDKATRTGMLDLLLRLQASGSKSYLFITHDLEMARNLTDSILVMQDGKIAESNISSNLCFGAPASG